MIYLKTGNVFVVEKAWQEGDQVKYQTASGLQTIPAVLGEADFKAKSRPSRSFPPSTRAGCRYSRAGDAGAPIRCYEAFFEACGCRDSRASARSTRYQDAPVTRKRLREHEKTGKPVALYFYVDWCKYCAQLERGILSRSEVKQYLDSILYVSVNPEHGKAEAALFEKFEGRGYPTFLILAKNHPAQEISTLCRPKLFSRNAERRLAVQAQY